MGLDALGAIALGLVFGAALVGAVVALRRPAVPAIPVRGAQSRRGRSMWGRRRGVGRWRSVGGAVAVGLVVLVATRWPVAAVGAAALWLLWPRVLGGNAAGQQVLDRLDALAAWTESLRDTSAAGGGLEQIIPATVPSAPAVLQPPLRTLTARLSGRVPLPEALRLFADDLDDPVGDMVVAALILNARVRSGGLVRILSALTASTREELSMRRTVEVERRGLRRQARLIVVAVLVFVAAQAVLSSAYVAPYSSVVGQVVLAAVLAVFVSAFVRLRSLADSAPPPRFLTSVDDVTEIASYKPVIR